jgi:hypothetical protein
MDLSFSPDDEAFRQQVRAFIRDHYPPEMRVKNPYTDPTEPATIAGSLPGDRPGVPSRRRSRHPGRNSAPMATALIDPMHHRLTLASTVPCLPAR